MEIKEAIKTIEVAMAEVEWNYPMDYATAFEMAIAALRAQQELEENEPLTLDELREIAESEAGAHIWVKDLVDGFVTAAIDVFPGKVVAVWTCTNDYCIEEDYGKTWLAYRRKPKEE